MNYRPWRDGRALLLAVAAAFGAYMAWLPKPERLATWQTLGVPPLSEAFGDLRVVTSGWDCYRRGIDVLAVNPCDPWSRPMNYPRLWLLPSLVGLGQSVTVIIGALMCLAFVVAILFLVGRLGLLETLFYGLALGSPAVLLAVERGNVDLIIFVLCVGGLLGVRRGGPAPTAVGVALILLATLLKLYPVFALAALIPRTRLAVGALLLAAVYALLTLPDFALISQGTPRPVLFAYGSEPVASILGVAPRLVDVGVVVAAGLVATLRPVRELARTSRASLESAAFVAGSVIYVGTFLIGSNWVYRLLFLVLTMPQLLAWLRSTGTRSSAIYILAAILSMLWLAAASMVPGLGTNEFQALSLIVFAVLGGLTAGILWTQTVAMYPQLTARIPRLKLSRA